MPSHVAQSGATFPANTREGRGQELVTASGRVQRAEQRAKSREQKAENREQRAENLSLSCVRGTTFSHVTRSCRPAATHAPHTLRQHPVIRSNTPLPTLSANPTFYTTTSPHAFWSWPSSTARPVIYGGPADQCSQHSPVSSLHVWAPSPPARKAFLSS